MSLTTYIRNVQSRFQAIPAPGAVFYDWVPARILKKPENRIVDDVVQKISGGVIVDLGSGTGYLSIEIAKRIPAEQVYGIDLSPKMVEIATRHAGSTPNVTFKFGDVSQLAFENQSVDFIVSTGSLHHWKQPDKVFDECYRVLKNGGQAWIYDPCCDALTCEPDNTEANYGFLRRKILTKITQMHGFSKQEYDTKIKDILDRSKFKDSYQMELTDIWMKTTLKKRGAM